MSTPETEPSTVYSGGSGLFRKLYDDGGVNTPMNAPENNKTTPTKIVSEDTSSEAAVNNKTFHTKVVNETAVNNKTIPTKVVEDKTFHTKVVNETSDDEGDSKSWYEKYYEEKNKNTTSSGDLEVDINEIDRIIELLLEAKEKIGSEKTYVNDQVQLINGVPDFTSAIGALNSEEVKQPLTSLEAKIDGIIEDYEYIKKRVKNYSTEGSSEDNKKVLGTVSSILGVSSSSSSGGSSYYGGGGSSSGTTTTEAPTVIPPAATRTTEAPTQAPTQVPTTPSTERPTEVITQPTTVAPTEAVTSAPTEVPTQVLTEAPTGGGTGGYSGGYYSGNYSGNNQPATTEAPTVAPTTADVIKKGNTYKLPTSSATNTTTTTTTSNKGNSAIPVLAGLAAAAAAGIGAKAYIDRKNNRDNDEEVEDFKTEDWSDNNDVNIEYQEPIEQKEETLDFDDSNDNYEIEEPEKYGARTHDELENLQ